MILKVRRSIVSGVAPELVCHYARWPNDMDTPQQQKPSDDQSAPEIRVSGKALVIVFVTVSLILAGIGTSMRLNVRPKWQAAVAASSAKAAELDAARAAAAASASSSSAKPQQPQK